MPKALMKKVPISEEEFLRKIGKMYGEYAIEEIECTYAVRGSLVWYCGSLTRNRYA